MEFVKFTGECSIGDKPIPVLDCQMWSGTPASQEERQWYTGSQTLDIKPEHDQSATVLYKFYKKPMASQHSMLQRSAITEKCKVSTAVQEYKRRWKNTSQYLPRQVYEEITQAYSDELQGMGYSVPWREEVIKSCLRGYNRILATGAPRNRPGVASEVAKRAKKLAR